MNDLCETSFAKKMQHTQYRFFLPYDSWMFPVFSSAFLQYLPGWPMATHPPLSLDAIARVTVVQDVNFMD